MLRSRGVLRVLAYQHVRRCEHTEGVQVGRPIALGHPRRTQGSVGIGMIGERLDDGHDHPVLEERQLAGSEVVQQGSERLRAHGDLCSAMEKA